MKKKKKNIPSGMGPHNPSAFIASCVKGAWRQQDPLALHSSPTYVQLEIGFVNDDGSIGLHPILADGSVDNVHIII